MIASKPKKSGQHGATYASGGSTKMAKAQAANPQKPGGTAHAVKGAAPGKRAAAGGPKTHGVSISKAAQAGRTAPPTKGR